MERCDILIVGGGPAGSSLAWALKETGLDIIIMDKASFPRHKVCAGWITPAVCKSLQLDLDNYRKNLILQPIHGFQIGVIGEDEIETDYPGDPVSYGIRRCEFDHYLLQRSGTKLKLGGSLNRIIRHGKSWIVNDNIQADLIIGAGGYYCPVARYLGAKLGIPETIVVAQEIEFKMTPAQESQCEIKPDIPELFFSRDLKGYGWAFRKGEYLNIGLGREDKHNLSKHVNDFFNYLKRCKKVPTDISHKFNGHAYLLSHRSRRRIFGDGMLLLGDAAGLAYAQSGEGIRPAIESGLLAAKVIKKNQGHYSSDCLETYQELIEQRFAVQQAKIDISNMIPTRVKQYLAKKLLCTHWFIRNVVIDRWFLHTNQPALLNTFDTRG